MWNPRNILKKENVPAGNKDISKAHTNLCRLWQSLIDKVSILTGEVCLYAYSFMCSIAKFSCNGKRENYRI